ncbi:hypothetical protein SDC9_208187 [bioreactor metagenome]|uniref:Uncharacterized protein n=1 Tax=bioreactor metagenome TaxID=1076179 RepID=A0A645JCI6_9ZZZZ
MLRADIAVFHFGGSFFGLDQSPGQAGIHGKAAFIAVNGWDFADELFRFLLQLPCIDMVVLQKAGNQSPLLSQQSRQQMGGNHLLLVVF